MAWNTYTVERGLVNEVCDLQVINKNKNYYTEFIHEYESDDGTGNFTGQGRVTLEVRTSSGGGLIATQGPSTVSIIDLSVRNNAALETKMVELVKDYMKI